MAGRPGDSVGGATGKLAGTGRLVGAAVRRLPPPHVPPGVLEEQKRQGRCCCLRRASAGRSCLFQPPPSAPWLHLSDDHPDPPGTIPPGEPQERMGAAAS